MYWMTKRICSQSKKDYLIAQAILLVEMDEAGKMKTVL